jgi:hypothetical protein
MNQLFVATQMWKKMIVITFSFCSKLSYVNMR